MAFKRLNDEELSLLNDNQRMQYEKEQDLYQQRVAFVERLEMLENAHVEQYDPQLETITVIDEINVKPFEKKEYDLFVCVPIQTPNLKTKPFKKIEQVTPSLPLAPKQSIVRTEHIHKPKLMKPSLPSIARPKVLVKSFKQLESKPADLPIVVFPPIITAIALKKWKGNLSHMPQNIPNIVSPDYKFASSLLKKAEFHKPKRQNINMPIVTKPAVKIRFDKKVKYTGSSLPQTKSVRIKTKSFTKPVRPKLNIPNIVTTCITARTFVRPQKFRGDVVMPTVPRVPARTFTITKETVLSLPKINIEAAPDAYSALNKLRLMSNKPQEI